MSGISVLASAAGVGCESSKRAENTERTERSTEDFYCYKVPQHGNPERECGVKPLSQCGSDACLRQARRRSGSAWPRKKNASQRVEMTSGRAEVSTTIAFRIAKLLELSLHDVLQGAALPKPATCPHCGKAIG
jgi:hypothetical protein